MAIRIFGFRTPGQKGDKLAWTDSNLVSANATLDTDPTMTLGRKADTAVNLVGTTASIMAYIKGLLSAVGSKVSVATPSAAVSNWTAAAWALFTVVGTVKIKSIIGVVTTGIAGAGATLEVGIAGNTACLMATITGTNLAAHDIWAGREAGTHVARFAVGESEPVFVKDIDIDLKVTVATVTAGLITFYIDWEPGSAGATLVAATWA